MHKKSDFQWTPEVEEAFKQMKKLIAELPTLTALKEHEELIIYLAAAKEAISAVLMTDREGRQIPVYFVSRTLRGPKVTYAMRFRFEATNNEAEYKALIAASLTLNEKEILDVVEEEGNTWMTPIYEYLAKEILLEDKKKARAVRRKAS
ncbi:reverse transcriptase domain-containing protein, partial [Tanacetum coccineum]